MIRLSEVSSGLAMARTRLTSRWTPMIAIGPKTRAITDMSGLWTTMTVTRPTSDRNSRPRAGDHGVQHLACGPGIVRHARDEVARKGAVVEVHAERQQMVVQALLGAGDDAVADPAEGHGRAEDADAAGERDRQDQHRQVDQPVGAVIDEDLIDHVLHDPGGRRGGAGDEEHEEDGDGVAEPVAAARYR